MPNKLKINVQTRGYLLNVWNQKSRLCEHSIFKINRSKNSEMLVISFLFPVCLRWSYRVFQNTKYKSEEKLGGNFEMEMSGKRINSGVCLNSVVFKTVYQCKSVMSELDPRSSKTPRVDCDFCKVSLMIRELFWLHYPDNLKTAIFTILNTTEFSIDLKFVFFFNIRSNFEFWEVSRHSINFSWNYFVEINSLTFFQKMSDSSFWWIVWAA